MEVPIEKTCTSCGQVKSSSEYYLDSKINRFVAKCKECVRARTRRWATEHRERKSQSDRRWRQENRERANGHYRNWRARNKQKHLELCRRWNAANRDRRQENYTRWKENNRGRLAAWYRQRWARLRAGKQHSDAEWHALLEAYSFRCLACGMEAKDTPEGFLTPDHVIPVCMSGPNTIDNIQPLCLDCNRRKNGRIIDYRPNW
jgi:hypothetical protein